MREYNYKDIKHRYPARVKPLMKDIKKFIRDLEESDGHHSDTFFCSPNVWKARGEKYGLLSDLILCIEGSVLYEILNYDEAPVVEEKFQSMCEKHGYYFEFGSNWFLAFYRR